MSIDDDHWEWINKVYAERDNLKAVNADLLAALEIIASGRDLHAARGPWSQFASELQQIARAAIAKARGE